jgi:hypothetical protein
MGGKRSAKRRAKKALRAIAKKRELGYCVPCSKLLWVTREVADKRVEDMKAKPDVRKPHLLDSYRCPHGGGFHIGHNYLLKWMSLCIGEHK